jgi:hypothetical protein
LVGCAGPLPVNKAGCYIEIKQLNTYIVRTGAT